MKGLIASAGVGPLPSRAIAPASRSHHGRSWEFTFYLHD